MAGALRHPIALMLFALAGCGEPPSRVHVTAPLELGIATTSHDIVGRDGAASAVAWGHGVWSFGDTVLQHDDAEGTNWHNNSFALSDGAGSPLAVQFSERTDASGALEYFIAPTPAEDAFNTAHRGDNCATPPCGARWAVWPGSMVFDEAGQRLLISYGLIAPDGESGGGSFAVWSNFDGVPERTGVSDTLPHGITLFPDDAPMYNEGPVIVDGQLYAFASTRDGLNYTATLGRVAVGHELDRGAWTFWTGRDWSAAASDAQALFSSGLGFNVFYDAHVGAWLVLYAAPFSDDVVVRSAKELTGPWSEAVPLFTANRHGGDPGTYDAYAHPELSPDDGRTLYVTFSRSNGDGWFGSEIVTMQVTLDAP
jgi:hypothetical protein